MYLSDVRSPLLTSDDDDDGLPIHFSCPDDAQDDKPMIGLIEIEDRGSVDPCTFRCMEPVSPFGCRFFNIASDQPAFFNQHLISREGNEEWTKMRDLLNKPMEDARRRKLSAIWLSAIALLVMVMSLLKLQFRGGAQDGHETIFKLFAMVSAQWVFVGIFLGVCWVPTIYAKALIQACDDAQLEFPKYVFAPVHVPGEEEGVSKEERHRDWFIGVALFQNISRQDIQKHAAAAAGNRHSDLPLVTFLD